MFTTYVYAHRVSIFAWVENGIVQVQGKFSTSSPARFSKITVLNPKNNDVLLDGKTDENGCFAFPVPDGADQHGLLLKIDAGEGHQNQWIMDPQEFPRTPLKQTTATENSNKEGSLKEEGNKPHGKGNNKEEMEDSREGNIGHIQKKNEQTTIHDRVNETPRPAPNIALFPIEDVRTILREEIQSQMHEELERSLAPIKKSLALSQDQGIRLTDIIGGIGWILGLFGTACFFLPKKK